MYASPLHSLFAMTKGNWPANGDNGAWRLSSLLAAASGMGASRGETGVAILCKDLHPLGVHCEHLRHEGDAVRWGLKHSGSAAERGARVARWESRVLIGRMYSALRHS